MFKAMEQNILEEVKRLLPNISTSAGLSLKEENIAMPKITLSNANLNIQNQSQNNSGSNDEKEVGRNDLCPCGSGKKYKKCHGK